MERERADRERETYRVNGGRARGSQGGFQILTGWVSNLVWMADHFIFLKDQSEQRAAASLGLLTLIRPYTDRQTRL